MSAEKKKRITDIGPPNYEQFLPPIIKKNYGKWKYHEYPQSGRSDARRRNRVTSSGPSEPPRLGWPASRPSGFLPIWQMSSVMDISAGRAATTWSFSSRTRARSSL